MDEDPKVAARPAQPGGEPLPASSPPFLRAGVPLFLVAAGICAAGALGLAVGVKVGKAVGEAHLAEPTQVSKIVVHECEKCREKAHVNAQPVTDGEVQAMLEAQRRVSDAG